MHFWHKYTRTLFIEAWSYSGCWWFKLQMRLTPDKLSLFNFGVLSLNDVRKLVVEQRLVRALNAESNVLSFSCVAVQFRWSLDILREGSECISSTRSPSPMFAWSGLVLRSSFALGEVFKSFSTIEKRVEMVQKLLLLPICRYVYQHNSFSRWHDALLYVSSL